MMLASAWWTASLSRARKLEKLGHYLAKIRPKKPQTPAEVLALFNGFSAAGVPMHIRKVKR